MGETHAPHTLHDRAASAYLHPAIGIAMVGLTLWLVLSVWEFAGDGYTDYLLVVVTGFFLVAALVPYVAWRVGRRHPVIPEANRQRSDATVGEWLSGEFETYSGNLKGMHAAAQMVLPFAAVAVGMTAFGIVLYLAERAAT